MNTLHATAISFDKRRASQPNLLWVLESKEEAEVRLFVSFFGSHEEEVALALPSSLPREVSFLVLLPLDSRAESLVLSARLATKSNTTLATGSTSLASAESTCGEKNPKAGRISILLRNESHPVATVHLETTLSTHFDHPLAHLSVPLPVLASGADSTLLIGHRGFGMNKVLFAEDSTLMQVTENTIRSFVEAFKAGAQFVEFDAQVTKDLKVVIYHDYLLPLEADGSRPEIRELTESEFLRLKPKFGDEPYATLEQALTKLPPLLGFNIELKYPLPDEIVRDNITALEYNLFIDTIFQTTFDLAGSREIVFSSFNPEICRMAKEKQSRYPVLFLTHGGTKPTLDTRSDDFLDAARFAKHARCDGIVTNAHALFLPDLDPAQQVADGKEIMGVGKWVWTYGEVNCVPGNAGKLMAAGVEGVIVDLVEQVGRELKGV
ncbi:Glycerophosphocholine phosphodiesterase [Podochytrium sp. JEL0797]|nr:Glycerophosphocholine phosphodiesterase [Podochytrium sp. JEL0797]